MILRRPADTAPAAWVRIAATSMPDQFAYGIQTGGWL